MSEYEKYEHHGHLVSVKSTLKGQHREHCLCWSCACYAPGCEIANVLFALCIAFNTVTPVWECPLFEEEDKDEQPSAD